MSYVTNQKALRETLTNKKHAMFITKYTGEGVELLYRRFAVIEVSPFIYKEYIEHDGKWIPHPEVASFLEWNGEFQGFDDISSLIEE